MLLTGMGATGADTPAAPVPVLTGGSPPVPEPELPPELYDEPVPEPPGLPLPESDVVVPLDPWLVPMPVEVPWVGSSVVPKVPLLGAE